jgi:hypothetical protein
VIERRINFLEIVVVEIDKRIVWLPQSRAVMVAPRPFLYEASQFLQSHDGNVRLTTTEAITLCDEELRSDDTSNEWHRSDPVGMRSLVGAVLSGCGVYSQRTNERERERERDDDQDKRKQGIGRGRDEMECRNNEHREDGKVKSSDNREDKGSETETSRSN